MLRIFSESFIKMGLKLRELRFQRNTVSKKYTEHKRIQEKPKCVADKSKLAF